MMKNTKHFLHSINPLLDTAFPFLTLKIENKECFPPNLGFRIMHWHEDLQFVLILKGKAHFQTIGQSFDLNSGEAVFINKGVLHQTIPEIDCQYRSFIFPEYFLTFYSGSFMEQKNVLPITENSSLPIIVFHSKELWQKQVVSILSDLNRLVVDKDSLYFYEYTVLIKLVSIWLTIISNIEMPTYKCPKSNIFKQERMRTFLSFINQHFEEDISLEDIARSANVSKTECIRCFKSVLQNTPYEYLLNYRLTKSIELLKSTDYSITKIAYMNGFKHTSHYIKYFKKKMKMTPLEYRRALSIDYAKLMK